MTSTQTPASTPHEVKPANPTLGTATVVKPQPDSRLDQLAAEYAALKPLADEYAARLKAITDGLKRELTTAAPGQTEVLLTSSYLVAPLQLQAVTKWALDTKALKAKDPETYVRWARQSTSWTLRALAG